MMQITRSEFNDIINTQSIPPVLGNYVTVQKPEHRIEYYFKNIEIVVGDRDYLSIPSSADFTFLNVVTTNLHYKLVRDNEKLTSSPRLRFVDCSFSQLESESILDGYIYVENCKVSSELRVMGQLRELHILAEKAMTINSIILELKKNGQKEDSIISLVLRSINPQDLQVNRIEILDASVDVRSNGARIDHFYIDSSLIVNVVLRKDRIEQIKLFGFNGLFRADDSTIGEFVAPGSAVNDAAFSFRRSFIGVCVMHSRSRFRELFFQDHCEIGMIFLNLGQIDSVHVDNSTIDIFYLSIAYFKFKQLSITGKDGYPTHINHLIFSEGTFKYGPDSQTSTIKLERFSISSLTLTSIINQSDIFVSGLSYSQPVRILAQDSVVHSHALNQFHIVLNGNPATLRSSYTTNVDTGADGHFRISDSDLGKINFISCDFATMKLDFKASKIIDIFLSGTEMPEQLIGRFFDRQIGYAQLKKIYDNRGDSVKSNDYLARELDAHYQSLKTENLKKENPAFKERTWTQWFDYVTLKIHKNSNNFGTSWRTSLWWVLLGSLPLYLAYAWTIGYAPTWPWRENAMFYGWQISSFFLEFLFPIHKADFIPEALNLEPNSLSRILESLGRLLNGYIIYQFIAAFRKYGKK